MTSNQYVIMIVIVCMKPLSKLSKRNRKAFKYATVSHACRAISKEGIFTQCEIDVLEK